jgi:hypothetical protein
MTEPSGLSIVIFAPLMPPNDSPTANDRYWPALPWNDRSTLWPGTVIVAPVAEFTASVPVCAVVSLSPTVPATDDVCCTTTV